MTHPSSKEETAVPDTDGGGAFDALLKKAFALPAGPRPMDSGADSGALLRCLRCGRTGRADAALCAHDGGPMAPSGDERIGQLVNNYRILECLGKGGAGTVYRARHRSLGREVAIKFLRPELAQDDEYRARLAREAQVIGQLDHEHAVRVIDFLTPLDASPILIMEYFTGNTLADALTAGADKPTPFGAGRALHITRQIAQALARAHGLGVLHRDIKPSNVLLTRLGDVGDYVKVLDFGIARCHRALDLTRSKTVVGTPRYMSPEQARRGDLGPQSDLYSLGCVLFEMLCGRPPFTGSPAMVMHAHVHAAPPSLQALAPDVPTAVSTLVHRLLDKSPSRRHRDAHHLLSSIQEAASRWSSPDRPALTAHPSTSPYEARLPGADAAISSMPLASEQELDLRLTERLAECEQCMPPTDGPGLQAIVAARNALGQLAEARAHLGNAALKAATDERAISSRRRQLGRALDGLGQTLSTETARVDLLAGELAVAAGATDQAIAAICRGVDQRAGGTVARGPGLDRANASRLAQLERAAGRLARAHTNQRAAEAAFQAGCQRRDDLAFQADQLRGRLASLQVESQSQIESDQARLAGLYIRQQACVEAAAEAIDIATETVKRG